MEEQTMTYRNRHRTALLVTAALMLAAGGFVFAGGASEKGDTEPAPMMASDAEPMETMDKGPIPENAETAVLAGGCFWGMEGVFESLAGVYDVVSGYSGGSADTARYSMVSRGGTGHAESVKITFDPKQISYRTLLEVFFSVAHDPTQLNYQGPDHGTQYRSAVFFSDETQRDTAEAYIAELTGEQVYADPIVTEVTPLDAFYPAEDYHQDFMRLNPDYPYIVYWDLPKLEHLKQEFPELIAGR
jgi:peptide-methionine (S)-S-oxide reductase